MNELEDYMNTEPYLRQELPIITKSLIHKLDKSNREKFEKLPETVIIYRGTHPDENSIAENKQSWTTDINIARHFAWVHYELMDEFSYKDMEDRVVLSALIMKNDIYGFIDDKYESECIVNTEKLKQIKTEEKFSEGIQKKLYNNHIVHRLQDMCDFGHIGTVTIRNFAGKIETIDAQVFLALHKAK